MHVADARPEDARRGLHGAIELFDSRNHVHGQAHSAYELVRLDRAEEVVDSLEELARRSSGLGVSTFAQHARAVVDDNAVGLEEVAVQFESMGMFMFDRRRRDPRSGRRSAGRRST